MKGARTENFNNLDYRKMFIIGVLLFPLGTITGILTLWALGFALVLIAPSKRSEWQR